MKINFFEEFPTRANLEKASMISFPSRIYLAATCIDDFRIIADKLHSINPDVDVGYWPVLKESYWISPFSRPKELSDLINDIIANMDECCPKTLLDLEFPLVNLSMFVENLTSFFKNRRMIRQIMERLEQNGIDYISTEYPYPMDSIRDILTYMGASHNRTGHKQVLMFYTSKIPSYAIRSAIRNYIARKASEDDSTIQVALGTIASGIFKRTFLLRPQNLDKDLRFLDDHGVEKAFIFRLGGLDEDYMNIIGKYVG